MHWCVLAAISVENFDARVFSVFGSGFANLPVMKNYPSIPLLALSTLTVGLQLLGGIGHAEPLALNSAHNNQSSIQLQHRQIRATISEQEPWLGLVGDSAMTGAATSVDINPNFWSLGALVKNFILESKRTVQIADPARIPNLREFGVSDEEPLIPLVRVMYSQEEFQNAVTDGRRFDINVESKGSLRLDIPEYSFGYLVGRGLGFPAERIVLVAQDGRRVGEIYKQMKRFGEISATLPSKILVSFSANDLCGDELAGGIEKFELDFMAEIRKQLKLTVENLKPLPRLGTKMVILAPLDVPQILTNPSLLAQKVDFQGRGPLACGDIRTNKSAQSDLGVKMKETLVSMCRAVIQTQPNDTLRIQKIMDFQRAQIRAWESVIAEIEDAPGFSFSFLRESRAAQFEKGDLANDCFHPGPGAHSKIGLAILKALKSGGYRSHH